MSVFNPTACNFGLSECNKVKGLHAFVKGCRTIRIKCAGNAETDAILLFLMFV